MSDGRRPQTLLWILIGGTAFFAFTLLIFSLLYFSARNSSDFDLGGEKIAVLDVEGVILQAKPFVDELKKYGDDSSIKAIILRIDSPGGGAAASQEMYDAVKRVRDQKKKTIVASIQTVGASGAYYIASGANKIYANRASVVGSIGVIAEWVNYGDLLHWAKLKEVIFTAGELKDAGDPAREMTPAERDYLQSLVNEMYGQFIHDVADGRKLKVDDVKAMASGRVWTGDQALGLKLIDRIGGFQDAVDETAKAVGIHGEPSLIHPEERKRTLFDILFGDVSQLLPAQARMLQTNNPGFFYLWR
ncbi:MAG: signal peptide peptidase SppA [Acidobacteria bacterium]|nr:signal peptide peptidase SppA [Acidobacteriota bacterium]MBV9146450.1 signal peptide peptidase SppA [Acidobacteriota bacterium]MBV9436023.1 signal peptide peptidase SppA [Acidobacteriota bacterium]